MEIIATLLAAAVVLAPIIGLAALIASQITQPPVTKQQRCEQLVSQALRSLDLKSYVVFDNLVLPSRGNTPHTEIDHVVVSPYGIFCIETKSHQGLIFGSRDSQYWTQCLGGHKYKLFSPYRQNYKHMKALEALLGSNLKVPIHSFAVFPWATKVEYEGVRTEASIAEVTRRISNHKQQVYNLAECERILKTLAYASSKSSELIGIHKQEVKTYLESKPA